MEPRTLTSDAFFPVVARHRGRIYRLSHEFLLPSGQAPGWRYIGSAGPSAPPRAESQYPHSRFPVRRNQVVDVTNNHRSCTTSHNGHGRREKEWWSSNAQHDTKEPEAFTGPASEARVEATLKLGPSRTPPPCSVDPVMQFRSHPFSTTFPSHVVLVILSAMFFIANVRQGVE